MTSPMRSAAANVFCSKCCRCNRTLAYPSSAKITTIAPSNNRFSFTLNVCVMRNQPDRLGSVSCMLQHRRRLRKFSLRQGRRLKRELLLGEDWQILHCQPEQREPGGNDHAGHRQLAPLGEVTHPR